MEKKATTKKVDKLPEIASCRKSMSETIISLRNEIRLLSELFDNLTIIDRNLIGEEYTEVLRKSIRMIHDINRNLEIPIDKTVAKVLFLETT